MSMRGNLVARLRALEKNPALRADAASEVGFWRRFLDALSIVYGDGSTIPGPTTAAECRAHDRMMEESIQLAYGQGGGPATARP